MGCTQSSVKKPSTSGIKSHDPPAKTMTEDQGDCGTSNPAKCSSVKGSPEHYPEVIGDDDWHCGNCGALNFRYRYTCMYCKTPRDDGVVVGITTTTPPN